MICTDCRFCTKNENKAENVLRSSENEEKLAALTRKKYPAAAEQLCQRARRYNESVALAQKYAKQGKVLIVAPNDRIP